jgi:IclR family transcriptional regulator, KDG regulon repressor
MAMVQSIERAFEIIRQVTTSDDGIRLQELSHLCGLKKTTVFALAETLVKVGMLNKDANSHYRLGELVKELHLRGSARRNLHRSAEILAELHLQFPTTEIIYTELGETDIFGRVLLHAGEPGNFRFTDGITYNPYLTVCGILYFAFLPDERLNGLRLRNPFAFHGVGAWGSEKTFRDHVAMARQRGWTKLPAQIESKRVKIGVPVINHGNNLITTITLITPRVSLKAEKLILAALFDTAKRISEL